VWNQSQDDIVFFAILSPLPEKISQDGHVGDAWNAGNSILIGIGRKAAHQTSLPVF
jgi:hypothetical protein